MSKRLARRPYRDDVLFLPSRMLRSLRGAAARPAPASLPLLLRGAAAGALPPRSRAGVAARQPQGTRADDVALSGDAAAVRRRRAGHARRRVHAARACPCARRLAWTPP